MTNPKVEYYVLTNIESNRHHKMKMRFEHENISANFSPVVEFTDPRINDIPQNYKRSFSCMIGHLDMIQQFIKSPAEYGIFCEDDIHIRRGMNEIIPETIAKYNRHNLEIMLLGYLFPFKPVELSFYHEPEFYHQKLDVIDENLIYFSYIDRLWGAQMYMLDKRTAKRLCEKYTIEYGYETIKDQSITPFAADWTITKDGRRVAVYPMLAIEEKPEGYNDDGQGSYHMRCYNCHYDEAKYI